MAMNVRQTVVGIFDEPAMADQAVQTLQNAGFDANHIHYSGHGAARSGGFFESLKRFFTGEDSAGTTGNDVDDFSHMGFSNEEARWYNDQYDAGRAVVSVRTADRMDEAMQILRSNGAYNYDMRTGTSAANVGTATATRQAPAGEHMHTTDVSQPAANYLGQPDANRQSADYLGQPDRNPQSADYLGQPDANPQSADYLGRPDNQPSANYLDTADTKRQSENYLGQPDANRQTTDTDTRNPL